MKPMWSRLAFGVLLTVLIGACSRPSPPAKQPVAVSTTAPPAATPALAAPPIVRPDPEPFRVQPRIGVRMAKGVRLYTGRGTFYLPIADLPGGTDVQYLDSREGWLYVRTPSGETGWVPGADSILTDGRNQAVTYRIGPSGWEIQTGSGPKIEAVRVARGVLNVVITGPLSDVQAQSMADGSLLLTGGLFAGVEAAVDIGDGGVDRISVSSRGLLLELENRPLHRLTQGDGDQITLEIRPGLDTVVPLANGWSLQTRGDLRPVLRQEGSRLVLDLPGTLLADDFPGQPTGLVLTQVGPEGGSDQAPGPSALTATVPTRMAMGGLRLSVPAPAVPYALYFPAPGQLELRYLSSGVAGKTILLDPGHGGEESGAVGVAGTLEKNVNLAVAMLLRPLLEQAGAKVSMTRSADTRVIGPDAVSTLRSFSERTQADLALRSTQANQAQADLMVSIHANAGPSGDGGTETYWAITNLNAANSQRLARLVQEQLTAALGLYDRGVKQRPFNVIRMSYAPAVLVELGFMSNGNEERLLTSTDGQRSAASALFRAIQTYFEG